MSDDIHAFLEEAKQSSIDLNLDLLKKSAELVLQLDKAKPSYSETALEQGLVMARYLLNLDCGTSTLAAAILYPCIYYNQPDQELLRQQVGDTVVRLINGASSMENIHTLKRQPSTPNAQARYADNIRKMLLAMVDDIRVVLIKLAERLAILNLAKSFSDIQKQLLAKQTMAIYAPLANRLGVGQLKWQLEDLAFRYLNPEEYLKISKALQMRRQDREKYVKNIVDELQTLVNEANIEKTKITGRAKHIFSIYRKQQSKNLKFDQLYDTTAARILAPSIKDCYTLLSMIHEKWQPITEEFDDYIAKPKPNGYQSLHTAIIGPNDFNVEIQIRTHKMHAEAELGIAAHWKYKEGNTRQSTYEEKIKRLREVIDWQKQVGADNEQSELYSNILQDRVYVFTPNGDIYDLPSGATPLDFAYLLHTDIGNHCKGAKVNDNLVPLTHTLQTGDQVNILTAKQSKPSRDWLLPSQGYLVTPRARAKVRKWFREENYDIDKAEGEDLWERAIKHTAINKHDIESIVERFNFKNSSDLYASIGAGDLSVNSLISYLMQKKAESEEQQDADDTDQVVVSTKIKRVKPSSMVIDGIDNVLTQIARCCKPIPGDSIIGYITKGRGISIHHQDCHNIQQAITNKPDRIIAIDWGNSKPNNYPIDLVLEANDRRGLIRDVSEVLGNEKISILALNTHINASKDSAYINLSIEVSDISSLEKLKNKLLTIDGITRIYRY